MKRLIFIFMIAFGGYALACTNLIVSRGASADGSTFITYAADSHTRYGQLRFCPAAASIAEESSVIYQPSGTPYSERPHQ